MKKLLAALLCFALFLTPAFAQGEEALEIRTSGDFEYVVPEDGTAQITGCNNYEAQALEIPAELDGLKVTGINVGAFWLCTSLTSITIPDGVTDIGNAAFSDCERLTSITIPDSVTRIGDGAFGLCLSLTSIAIPDSVTDVGSNPFEHCKALQTITVSPDHPALEMIDGVLFGKADKRLICYPCAFTADSYAIPQGTEIIGEDAFAGCKNLASITIPEGVTRIGDAAFYNCDGLMSITIPESVTRIGDHAFYGCGSLTSIAIPESVTRIGKFAFGSCVSLPSITIPDSVTGIGYGAFAYCESLSSVNIPDGVTHIGENAFARCSDDLTLTVARDSYAAQYCKDYGLNYAYPDSPDGLDG